MKISKKISIFIVCLCVLASSFALQGCDQSSLNRIAKGLSQYTINASLDDSTHTINAHQRVEFVNNYDVPLKELRFHLYAQAYREGAKYTPITTSSTEQAYPNGTSYGSISISNVMADKKAANFMIGGLDEDVLIVPFATALYPTAKTVIELDFVLRLANIRHRLGYSEHTINLGNWYPIACVYHNGSFCEHPYFSNGDPFFSEVANYEVNLTVPSDYVVASTGTYTAASSSNGTLYNLKAQVVRDFALVLSREFKTLSDTQNGVQIQYFYVQDEAPQNSMQAAKDALATFSDMIGDYPYASLSVVETAFLHGGMEYPQLVMISDVLSGDMYLEVIIHEIAHQWWYAVVGNNQVEDAWMDEGLTEYTTTLFYEKNTQYNQTRQERVLKTVQNYLLYVDVFKSISGKVDTSMNRSLKDFGEYEYVYMVYLKGELMFDSLRLSIGDKNFFDCLQDYYKQMRFKNARKEDMIGIFEHASNTELAAFFDSWLSGKVHIAD